MRKICLPYARSIGKAFVVTAILATATAAKSQTIEIDECVAITDRLARFDCFERLAAEAMQTDSENRIAPVAPGPAAAPAAAVSTITNSTAVAPPVTAAPPKKAVETRPVYYDPYAVVEGIVASAVEREPNQLVITLEDGQVWYQTVGSRYRLREGMQISINHSGIGNGWRLRADELRGDIRVRRVSR